MLFSSPSSNVKTIGLFPKGTSIDNYEQDKIVAINKTINEMPLRSLDGNSPKDAFALLFGHETYDKLFGI